MRRGLVVRKKATQSLASFGLCHFGGEYDGNVVDLFVILAESSRFQSNSFCLRLLQCT